MSAINFTFHNSWVLDMLREKGDYIKWQEWKKLNMLNRVLTKRIRENLADARETRSTNKATLMTRLTTRKASVTL